MPENPGRLVPRRATAHPNHKGANVDDARGTDINTLVAQYRKTGTVPNVAQRDPYFSMDLDPRDLTAAYELVATADARFEDLPAAVRKLCDHRPENLLTMLQDPDKSADLEAAGLTISNNPPRENYSPQETPSLSPGTDTEVVSTPEEAS